MKNKIEKTIERLEEAGKSKFALLMFIALVGLIVALLMQHDSKASGLLTPTRIVGGVGSAPASLAAGSSTNIDFVFDCTQQKDCAIQFTGVNTVNSTNTYTFGVYGNNTGTSTGSLTNAAYLGTLSFVLTGVVQSTYMTNLSTANNQCGGIGYIHIVGLTNTTANAGTGALTNWFVSVNSK